MDANAFTGGIKPGGLTVDYEVNILICFLLDRVDSSMSFTELNDVLQLDGSVNYFEFSQALSKLLASGHVESIHTADGEERFLITELGVKTSRTFEKSIPITVRDGVLVAARNYLLQKKLEKENSVTIKSEKVGYTVSFSITDMGSDLMNISLFVPTARDAANVKMRFLRDPATIYRGVVALLTGDDATVRYILSADTSSIDHQATGETHPKEQ